MTFLRLRRGHAVAGVAALVLLLVSAMDWYSTKQGEEARRAERLALPEGAEGANVTRGLREEAEIRAEQEERNAWQADALVDRLLLLLLLAAVLLAFVAAARRAAGRPSVSASRLAFAVATAGALLITYRIIQPPGLNSAATVKAGALLGLLATGALAFGALRAFRGEQAERRAAAEEPAAPSAAGPVATGGHPAADGGAA